MCSLCLMKTFKLMLSDSASSRALERASNHGVPVEAYLSGEMEDLLDGTPQPVKISPSKPFNSASESISASPNFSSTMPDTLQQVLDVCKYLYRNGNVPKDERHAKS